MSPEERAGGREEPGHHDGEGDGAVDRVKRRDELLQVLFWLEGEGFESELNAAGVSRFLQWPERSIRRGLAELVEDGFATVVGDDVRLTHDGRQEGGRRFVAEFATLLSRDTHAGGECHDPNCDCHQLGPAACTAFPRERD
ncbi:MAG: hypothetical protein ACR2GQ_10795 [Gemmatimonadota bacterium]|jgi:hypothetical protein